MGPKSLYISQAVSFFVISIQNIDIWAKRINYEIQELLELLIVQPKSQVMFDENRSHRDSYKRTLRNYPTFEGGLRTKIVKNIDLNSKKYSKNNSIIVGCSQHDFLYIIILPVL